MSVTVERLVADIEANPDQAVAALTAFDAVVGHVARDRSASVEVNTGSADRSLILFESEVDAATRDRDVNIHVDEHGALRGFHDVLDGITTGLGDVEKAAEGASSAIGNGGGGGGGGFSNVIDGAGKGGAIFMGTLTGIGQGFSSMVPMIAMWLGIASVLPGAFAAAAAGAGILVGALAPLLGLLGAIPVALGAFALVGGTVMAALAPVIQGVSAYKAASAGASVAAQDLAAKQHALVSANQAVANSIHQVTQAEQALSDARKNMEKAPIAAAEAIKQAHFTAAQSIINEKEAVLALEKAQKNLTAAQEASARAGMTLTKQTDAFTGKTYDVAYASADAVKNAGDERQARLDLQQAELNLAEARDASAQAQRDLNDKEKKGIKNSDIMVAARRQLAQAEWSLKQAHQAVANAQYQAAQAQKALNTQITTGTAAQQGWTKAQKMLSSEGIHFVKFLADDFLPSLGQVAKAAQDGLLPGVEDGLRLVEGDLGSVAREVKTVGHLLGTTFDEMIKFWTKPAQKDTLSHMFHGLNDVIRLALRLLNPLSRVLVQVTDDAVPMVRILEHGLINNLNHLADWMESDHGKKKTRGFFKDAAHFTGLWLDVLKPIGGIIEGIASAAQPLAERWLKSMAGYFGDINDEVNSLAGQRSIKSYFEEAVPTLKEVGGLVGDLIDTLFNSSQGGTDSSFYKFVKSLRDDLLPAVDKTFKRLDKSTVMSDLVTNIGDLVVWLNKIDWNRVSKDIDKVSGAFHSMSKWMDRIDTAMGIFDKVNLVLSWLNPLQWMADHLGAIHWALSEIKKDWDDYTASMKDAWEKTKDKWGDFKQWWSDHIPSFSDMWNGVESAWDATIEYVKQKWGDFKDWLKDNIPTPKDILGDIGSSIAGAIPGVKHWSGGAVEANKTILVGEHGPELFNPSVGGRIAPAAPTRDVLRSNGAGITDAQLERVLERVLMQAKPNVKMDVVNYEKVDPLHLARELAWSLA